MTGCINGDKALERSMNSLMVTIVTSKSERKVAPRCEASIVLSNYEVRFSVSYRRQNRSHLYEIGITAGIN